VIPRRSLLPSLLVGAAAATLGWGLRPAGATNTGEDVVMRVTTFEGQTHEGEVRFSRRRMEVHEPRRVRLQYRDVSSMRSVPAPTREEAQAEFDQRSQEADSVDAWLELAAWARERGLTREAEQACEQALELDHTDARAHLGLGEVLEEGEWVALATLVRERRVELEPDDLDGLCDLAEWAKDQGSPDLAFELLRDVLRADAWHTEALRRVRPYTDRYRQHAELILPVRGRWQASEDRTRHHGLKAYAVYALDLLMVNRDGETHRDRGRELEDYYTWGQPFYAVAAGTVIEVRDGFPDNPIGRIGDAAEKHNGVAIDHGNGEYSWYVHAKNGSIVVEEGQVVEQGQLLGEVGNSGGSAVPHLHFTLTAYNAVLSVPWECDDFVVYAPDGTPLRVERGWPREDWIVESQAEYQD
jgi:tetratricopeptide (TPR) repeat protein